MATRFTYRRVPGAELGTLNVVVQRVSGEHYVTVGAGDSVAPGETMRILATGIGYFTDYVEIVVAGDGGSSGGGGASRDTSNSVMA